MKSVLWISCSRLSCSNSVSPLVVLCLSDTSLVAPPECLSDVTQPFNYVTIEATLTKSWRDCSPGCDPQYRYLLQYNESDLVDPNTPLTTAQISGVFCKGCLTDWVEEEVGNEVTLVDNGNGTITLTSQHGCQETVSYAVNPVIVDWIIINDTWTYHNSTQATVPASAQNTYRVGDRVRLKQGLGFEYFYILAISSPTILTLFGGDDYALANLPITDIAFSRIDDPFGFPAGFNYTPFIVGSSGVVSAVSIGVAYARLTGNVLETWFSAEFTLGTASALYISVNAIANWYATKLVQTMLGNDAAPYNGIAGAVLEPSTSEVRIFKPDSTTHWAIGDITLNGSFKGVLA